MSGRFSGNPASMKIRDIVFRIATVWIPLCLILVSCKGPRSKEMPDSFRSFLDRFESPPASSRPVVHWVWNSRITREEIEFQIDELNDKGFAGLIVSADERTDPPQASKLWQDLVLSALSRADSLGLKVWIDPGRDSLPDLKTFPPEISVRIPARTGRPCLWNSASGNLAARLAVSEAGQSGRSVVMAGLNDFQEESFTIFKSACDRVFALGFNAQCLSPSLFSIHGVPKSPDPSFSYHSPWWELFRPFSDYIARISLAMQMGTPIRPVLVLDPAGDSQSGDADIGALRFEAFLDTLDRFNVEYDLAGAAMIEKAGRAEGGRLIVLGGRAYSALVIPPEPENPGLEIMNRIDERVRSGLRVVCFTVPFDEYKNKSSAEARDRFSPGCVFEAWTDSVSGLLASDGFMLIPGRPEDRFLHQRRKLMDGELLFLVNLSQKDPAKGKIRMAGEAAFRLDPVTGIIEKYPAVRMDSAIEMQFELPPAGSLLLCSVMTDTFGFHSGPVRPLTGSRELRPEGQMKIIPSYFNSLTLDRCDWISDGKKMKTCPVSGNTEVVRGEEQVEIVFTFDLHRQVDPSTLMAVVEDAEKFTVKLNGSLVEPMRDAWLIDRSFGVYGIPEAIPGQNKLSLVPRTGEFKIPPVYLYGDFSLVPSSGTWKLDPLKTPVLKPWKDQGMPFYSDAMAYISAYRIVKTPGQYYLIPGRWNGSAAEVRINDIPAGLIGWPPCQLDVTDRIVNGMNHVEVNVYGTLENSFLSFRSRPSGEQDRVPFGLFGNFQLRFTPSEVDQK